MCHILIVLLKKKNHLECHFALILSLPKCRKCFHVCICIYIPMFVCIHAYVCLEGLVLIKIKNGKSNIAGTD